MIENDFKKYKVSIVIPCYNAELYIQETLESVFNQVHTNIEIILINDGSSDNSEKIIQQFVPRITYISRVNKGVSFTRNEGLKIATGDFILFLDADDLLPPTFISSRLKLILVENSDISCGLAIDYEDNEKKAIRKAYVEKFDIAILNFNSEINTCPSSYLINLEKLKESGVLFCEQLSSPADKFFLLQLINSKFTFSLLEDLEDALLYRVHEKSMSNSLNLKLLEDAHTYFEILRTDLVFSSKILRLNTICKCQLILSGGYYKLGYPLKSIRYALLSFFWQPFISSQFLLGKILKR